MNKNIYNSWILNTPIAHRGLHSNNIPENTLEAFKCAIDAGYAIELDIHITHDKQIVVIHDYDTRRMTGIDYKIRKNNLSEITKLYITKTSFKIPSLQEVFDLVNGIVPILIEIKNDYNNDGEFESILYEQLKTYKGEIAIQSFNHKSVEWFKNNAPEIYRGLLSFSYTDVDELSWIEKFKRKNLLYALQCEPDFIGYKYEDRRAYIISYLLNKKQPVIFWTIKKEEAAKEILALKNTNIIFEKFKA